MIVTIIEKVYSFLWGDMIRIPLPGGSGLGILFYARSNVAYLFGDKWCWQTAYKILALIMLFSGGMYMELLYVHFLPRYSFFLSSLSCIFIPCTLTR